MIEDSLKKEFDEISVLEADLRKRMAGLQAKLREREATLKQSIEQAVATTNLTTIDKEKLAEFLEIFPRRPYVILSKSEKRAIVASPIHIPIPLGWLVKQDGAYYLWEVNKFVPLFQEVPQALLDELDFSPVFDGITVEQGRLRIERPDLDSPEAVFRRYRKHLSKIEDDHTIRVKPHQEFELIAALIRDGVLPFAPRPVDKADLRDVTPKVLLRDYQHRDYKTWLENGAVGIQYPMGAGKSFVALYALEKIKGPKIILVPNLTLKEVWAKYLREETNLPSGEVEVFLYHKNTARHLKDKEFTLVVFDEMHRLPANTFLSLAALKTKYRLNLTGTPWREDGRHDLVLALSGIPLGVDWSYFIKAGIIKQPTITVHVVKDQPAKLAKLAELLQLPGKTLIFCDSLALGEKISKTHGIPFVSGSTKNRLDIIREHEKVAISRVGDLGISLKDLRRVIEIDFLYGSRTQEAQRIGRLHHAKQAGEHFLIMSAHEYLKYRKRLWGVESKGFKVTVIKAPGAEKTLEYVTAQAHRKPTRTTPAQKAPVKQKPPRFTQAIKEAVKTGKLPLLSDRTKPSKETLMMILGSRFATEREGLFLSEVFEILSYFFIDFDKDKVQWIIRKAYEKGGLGGQRVSKTRRKYFKT